MWNIEFSFVNPHSDVNFELQILAYLFVVEIYRGNTNHFYPKSYYMMEYER